MLDLHSYLEASKAEAQALRNNLASVTAERDAALQRAEYAEAKIEAARAALED